MKNLVTITEANELLYLSKQSTFLNKFIFGPNAKLIPKNKDSRENKNEPLLLEFSEVVEIVCSPGEFERYLKFLAEQKNYVTINKLMSIFKISRSSLENAINKGKIETFGDFIDRNIKSENLDDETFSQLRRMINFNSVLTRIFLKEKEIADHQKFEQYFNSKNGVLKLNWFGKTKFERKNTLSYKVLKKSQNVIIDFCSLGPSKIRVFIFKEFPVVLFRFDENHWLSTIDEKSYQFSMIRKEECNFLTINYSFNKSDMRNILGYLKKEGAIIVNVSTLSITIDGKNTNRSREFLQETMKRTKKGSLSIPKTIRWNLLEHLENIIMFMTMEKAMQSANLTVEISVEDVQKLYIFIND